MNSEIVIPQAVLDIVRRRWSDEQEALETIAMQEVARWMREECAKVAEEKVSFSSMPNPSDLDRGWKRCAAKIAEDIRRVAQ